MALAGEKSSCVFVNKNEKLGGRGGGGRGGGGNVTKSLYFRVNCLIEFRQL